MHQAHYITPEYRQHLDDLHRAAIKAIEAGNSPARTIKRLRWDYENAWWSNQPKAAAKAVREARSRRSK